MKTSGFRRRGGARAQPAKVWRAPMPSRLVGAIVLSGLCCVPSSQTTRAFAKARGMPGERPAPRSTTSARARNSSASRSAMQRRTRERGSVTASPRWTHHRRRSEGRRQGVLARHQGRQASPAGASRSGPLTRPRTGGATCSVAAHLHRPSWSSRSSSCSWFLCARVSPSRRGRPSRRITRGPRSAAYEVALALPIHPRQVNRALALDEADDLRYCTDIEPPLVGVAVADKKTRIASIPSSPPG